MSKYVHLTNNIVDFEMEAHPSNVFGSPYKDEFVFTENDAVTTGWRYENDVFIEPVVIIVIPIVISMRQARLQLLALNLLDSVNSAISTMSQAAQIEWEYATEVRRDNPLVSALATALNMTDLEMDDFYKQAVTL